MRRLMFLLVLVLFCSVPMTSSAPLELNVANCCMNFSNVKIPVRLVKSYSWTSSTCPRQAIVFQTLSGRKFCVDPETAWVNGHVDKVDKRTTTTPTTTSARTTSATTTSATKTRSTTVKVTMTTRAIGAAQSNCCMNFSNVKIPVRLVKSYSWTSSTCPRRAIVFQTLAGREFCIDPETTWVNGHVDKVDKRTREHQSKIHTLSI